MRYEDIIALLSPDMEPVEHSYLWAKFDITGIVPECSTLYYCVNDEIATELLVNQIKPTLVKHTGYFVIFPVSDVVEIDASMTGLSPTFAVTHFGWYDGWKSEAIARTHVTQLLEYFRNAQNKWISAIRVSNTTFNVWDDSNSVVQQYVAMTNVTATAPYALAEPCN